MTEAAFHNAETIVDMALGCSTNTMLHLPAIAHECGIELSFDMANEISARTPNLCHLAPAGHLHGGPGAGWRRVRGDGGAGQSRPAGYQPDDLHRQRPLLKTWRAWSTGTPSSSVPLRIPTPDRRHRGPQGQPGPDGCVVKQSAVAPEMMVHEGPARVFDSEEDAIQAIYSGKIAAGDVVVIRYEGPKGGPGMREMLNPTSAIAGMGLDKEVAPDHRRPFLRRHPRRIYRPCLP